MEINGQIYEWGDISVSIQGQSYIGFTGIKYKPSAEQEGVYAKGRNPVKIATGNIKYEGEIVVLQSVYLDLKRKYGKGLYLLYFNITVSYGNPFLGQPMTTDIIENFKFMESEKGMSQGDKKMEITMPFLALNIRENV